MPLSKVIMPHSKESVIINFENEVINLGSAYGIDFATPSINLGNNIINGHFLVFTNFEPNFYVILIFLSERNLLKLTSCAKEMYSS